MRSSGPDSRDDRMEKNDRDLPSALPGDRDPDARRKPGDPTGRDIQPGTAGSGRSWHSRSPDPDDKDDKLNQELKDSFPASDPAQSVQPGVTGWDLTDEEEKERRKRSAA